jgi:hypothetical protein
MARESAPHDPAAVTGTAGFPRFEGKLSLIGNAAPSLARGTILFA